MATHTYAVLDVSEATYREVREKLGAAGYEHAFDRGIIDMHGIALRAESVNLKALQLEIRDDGSLVGEVDFVSFQPGDPTVTLDGVFTIDQLQAIIAHMRSRRR